MVGVAWCDGGQGSPGRLGRAMALITGQDLIEAGYEPGKHFATLLKMAAEYEG
jgi:hypothetical protein